MSAVKKYTEGHVNRRQFLVAGAATVAGCSQDVNTITGKNLYGILNNFEFRGQDGEPVNIAGLQAKLSGKYTTLTFSFNTCDQFCPTTDQYLSQLDERNRDLTHLVIAVRPMEDGGFTPGSPKGNQAARDEFLNSFSDAKHNVKNKVVLLFPQDAKKIPAMVNALGEIAKQDVVIDHSPIIVLAAPDGTIIGKKFGIDDKENIEDWKQLLGNAQQKQGIQ